MSCRNSKKDRTMRVAPDFPVSRKLPLEIGHRVTVHVLEKYFQ